MSQGSLYKCVYNLCYTNKPTEEIPHGSSTTGNGLKKKTLLPKAEIKCGLIFSSHNKLLLSEIDVSM